MKTLDAIEEVCRVLEKHCASMQDAQRVLVLTQNFLAVTVEIWTFDPTVTAARVHEMARDRMRRITDKTAPGGSPAATGESPVPPRNKK
jgi:hypothetical protein